MAAPRREAGLQALLAPIEADVRAHLGVHPPRVRACLALALAADRLSETTTLAFDTLPDDDAARLIELAGRLDGLVADLWQASGPGQGQGHGQGQGAGRGKQGEGPEDA